MTDDEKIEAEIRRWYDERKHASAIYNRTEAAVLLRQLDKACAEVARLTAPPSASAIQQACAVAHTWFAEDFGRIVAPQEAAGELWQAFARAIEAAESRGREEMSDEAARAAEGYGHKGMARTIRAIPLTPPARTQEN